METVEFCWIHSDSNSVVSVYQQLRPFNYVSQRRIFVAWNSCCVEFCQTWQCKGQRLSTQRKY